MTDDTATMSPVTETTAPAPAEAPSSNDGDSMHAEMAETFSRLNPSGETSAEPSEVSRLPHNSEYTPNYEGAEVDTKTGDTEIEAKAPAADDIKPPQSLNAQERDAWAKLPKEAQDMVARCSLDAQRQISRMGQEVTVSRQINELLAQHRDFVPTQLPDGQQVTPQVAVATLLNAEKLLREKPLESILWLAESNGINLQELLGGQAQQAQYDPQQVQALVQEQAWQLTQHYLAQHQERELQAKEQYLTREIERFSKDAARSDHWHEVEDDIFRQVVALRAEIAAGIEPQMDEMAVLKAAYERATSRNPAVFVKTAKGREKAAQEKKKADEAKRLASLNAKSHASSTPRAVPKDMYQEMEAVWDRLHGRS